MTSMGPRRRGGACDLDRIEVGARDHCFLAFLKQSTIEPDETEGVGPAAAAAAK